MTKFCKLILRELQKPDPPKTVKLERLLLELDDKIAQVRDTHSACADAEASEGGEPDEGADDEQEDELGLVGEQQAWLEERQVVRDTLVLELLERRSNNAGGTTPSGSSNDEHSDRGSVTTAVSRPYIKLDKLSTMKFDGKKENEFP